MIKIRQKLNDGKEQVAVLPEEKATEKRLKYQFQLLLKGIRMVDVDGRDRQFRLIKDNEIIGYFYMEKA